MKDKKWNEHYKRSNEIKCDSKRIYNSFAEASSFNKRARKWLPGNKKKEHLHVYRCNCCRQWHIGHEPTRNDRD